jgi:glutamate-1-semialdehyde 2,1-aminomutase
MCGFKRSFLCPPYLELEVLTSFFVSEFKSLWERNAPFQIMQKGSLFWFSFESETSGFPYSISKEGATRFSRFYRKALGQGVYFAPSPYEVGFMSTAHSREVLNSVLEKLSRCTDIF